MTILTSVEKEEIQYPSSDGKPRAESDITRDCMTYSVEALKLYFQERSDVCVSTNSFIYYEVGFSTVRVRKTGCGVQIVRTSNSTLKP
jgi:hypothetical protein